MQNNFKIEGGKLIIEVPMKTRRFNPYEEMATGDGDVGEMNNIVAVIDKKSNSWDELGFAHWIDMSYKGKDDQVSSMFFVYGGSEEDFRKLVSELKLDLVEM